jgi:hypothetical protein
MTDCQHMRSEYCYSLIHDAPEEVVQTLNRLLDKLGGTLRVPDGECIICWSQIVRALADAAVKEGGD